MRINLRKAMRLRKDIEAALSEFQLPTELKLDVDAVDGLAAIEEAVSDGRKALSARLALHAGLSSVLAEVRKGINAANASGGVDAALADGAAIDREIRLQQRVAGAARAEASSVIAARAHRARAALGAPEQGYGRGASSATVVSAQLVTEEMAAAAAKRVLELKREREAVEDRRLALNAGTEIEIGEEGVGYLRVSGLI
jgi:hypothetical protein